MRGNWFYRVAPGILFFAIHGCGGYGGDSGGGGGAGGGGAGGAGGGPGASPESAFDFESPSYKKQFDSLGFPSGSYSRSSSQPFNNAFSSLANYIKGQTAYQNMLAWNNHVADTTPYWLGGRDYSGANRQMDTVISETSNWLYATYGLDTSLLGVAASPGEPGYHEGFDLHFRSAVYPDGSRRVDYFQDPDLQEGAGFTAMDAPLWSGESGEYPLLIRYAADLTIHGERNVGAAAFLIENPEGSSGRYGVWLSDEKESSFLYRADFSGDAIVERGIFLQGENWLDMVSGPFNDVGIHLLFEISASSGARGKLTVFNDGSGAMRMNTDDLDIFLLVWRQDNSGYVIYPDGQIQLFADVNVYLALGV